MSDLAPSMVPALPSQLRDGRLVLPLLDGLIVAEQRHGGYVVAPGYNNDVAIGLIRDGIIEPWTTRAIQELVKPGDTYVNVGANFGYYTAMGPGLVNGNGKRGKVISIEANPHVFAILLRTISWSGGQYCVEPYCRAAYFETGTELEFSYSPEYIANGHIERKPEGGRRASFYKEPTRWNAEMVQADVSSIGKWDMGHSRLSTVKVLTVTLDDVLRGEERVDVVHMDIEAAEPLAFAGMRETWERFPNLKLVFEWVGRKHDDDYDGYRDYVNGMWDAFAARGCNVRQLETVIHPDGAISTSPPLSKDAWLAGQHGDYIAIPKDQDPWGT